MAKSLKKRGQKVIRRWSRTSQKVSEEGKEHIRENLVERISHIQNIRLLIFEWSLLVLALIMLSVTQAFWFGESYATHTFVGGGSYIEATLGRVNSLNPLFATTSSEKVLSRLMFARLVANDYSGHTGPGLADTVRSSEDGKVWTVRLRDGLYWSDGEPITNEDVLFTTALIQNPVVNSIYDSNLENVRVAENEKGEIVFTLPVAYADFATALEIPIVPKHALEGVDPKVLIEAAFSNTPVTSGAFAFNATQATSTSDDSVVYLSGNQYYYGGTPLLTSFGVHTYQDKESIIAALNGGAVTATAELAGDEVARVTSGTFVRTEAGINVGAFAFFNTTSGVFRNAGVRRAVREGIDFASLRAAAPGTHALDYPLLESQITLASWPVIPKQDAVHAQEVLNGVEGGLTAKIVTVSSGYLPAVAEALKEQLEGLGFDCGVTVYEETQDFITNVISQRSYDVLVYEVELGADPDLLPYYHSSQASGGGLNLSGYRNVLVDDLLIGARETLDPTLRARKYESFLEYWVADAPALGLYQANMTYVHNRHVRTFDDESLRLVTGLDRFIDVRLWATNKGTRYLGA